MSGASEHFPRPLAALSLMQSLTTDMVILRLGSNARNPEASPHDILPFPSLT